ncbi:hypothetical protein Dimus_019120 [Dionaea muscipula]
MGTQAPKSSSKPTKPLTQTTPSMPRSSSSASSSLSSHLAMVELKQRILNSLSKLSDRDTQQIAIEELESTINTLQNDAVPMLINCLFDASSTDPKPAAKKESLRLLGVLSASHTDSTSTHLVKIVAHVAKRLRDPDPGVREACRDVIGILSGVYLKGECENGNGVVSLFAKPLFEAMGENNKGVQVGAAMCLGKVVESAKTPPVSAFQKLCPRICKYLNSPNFFAKSALLSVAASLSQLGAVPPQSLEPLLQSIHECLASTDWATRKAAADTLTALAMHSSDLIKDITTSTLTVLEGCRFDKIKPVRESMTEALQIWKRIAGNADGAGDEQKALSHDAENPGPAESMDKSSQKAADTIESKVASLGNDSSNADFSMSNSDGKLKGMPISDRTVGILKKKVPVLTDKELNPEFFQNLETRGSGDLPVEVIVPRRGLAASNPQEEVTGHDQADVGSNINKELSTAKHRDFDGFRRDRWVDPRVHGKDQRPRAFDYDDRNVSLSTAENHSEGSFISNKGNWHPIQRQLLHLERQQANLMKMLQDFMGGSHDSMITLENRVRGLERVVEDMAQDLSMSSGRRGGNFMPGFEGSSNRPASRYSGLFDYSAKLGRGVDGRLQFGDRFSPSEGMRGRGPPWRSDLQESWDFHPYGAVKNGQTSARRDVGNNHLGSRSPGSDHENDQVGGRRAWDKGVGPIRLGEGPSARSVWQASKDEATLEAIRVAGDDNGTARTARAAVPEMTAEALGSDNVEQEQDLIWTCWRNAMDALQVGDMDSAYAEVLSTGDDFLLVKLMDQSGPVLDQLSNGMAIEIVSAVLQLVLEQNLFDICFSWVQQLVDLVMENGPGVFGIPMEIKRELLFNLHEASSTIELPEDWQGATPEQLMLQLASSWGIDLQQHSGQ